MRLASFYSRGLTRVGVVRGEEIVDLAEADPQLPETMTGLLGAGPAALEAAHAAGRRSRAAGPLSGVRLAPPVPRPGKILAIGMNYRDHIAELGREPPAHQVWFNKQPGCVTGPYDPVERPVVSSALDYEGELCFVIGRRCRHVPRERAGEVIAGFCVGNDVSVRDWQMRTPTMIMGKGFDSHGPLGPWLTTADEVADPHDLAIRTHVNDELRQDGHTGEMIFDCYDQIAHLSQAFTLEPGDVIFTGTPRGVGAGHDPPRYLAAGDRVRIEIDGLGSLDNPVVDEDGATVIE